MSAWGYYEFVSLVLVAWLAAVAIYILVLLWLRVIFWKKDDK